MLAVDVFVFFIFIKSSYPEQLRHFTQLGEVHEARVLPLVVITDLERKQPGFIMFQQHIWNLSILTLVHLSITATTPRRRI